MTTSEATYSVTWKLGTDSYLAPLFTVRGDDDQQFTAALSAIIGEDATYKLLQKAAEYASSDGGMSKAVANVQQGFPGAQAVPTPPAVQAAPQWPQQPTGPTSNAQAQGWGAAAPPAQPPAQPAGGPPPGQPSCAHGPTRWVPPGITKTGARAGQQYPGFWSCPAPQGQRCPKGSF